MMKIIDGSANCVVQIGGLYRAKSAVMGIVYLDACDVVPHEVVRL